MEMVRTLNCGPYTVDLFTAADSQPVVYAVMDQAEAQAVWSMLREPKPALAAVSGVDWNRDLSPWPAPRVFRGNKDFGGEGPSFLDMLTGRIVPLVETQLGFAPASRAIAGYSLAGLFALWSVFQTDVFDRAASVSGSLWFDGFMDYMNSSTPPNSLRGSTSLWVTGRRMPEISGWRRWRTAPAGPRSFCGNGIFPWCLR